MREKHNPKRRILIKQLGLAAGTLAVVPNVLASNKENDLSKKVLLRVAHITDVHIRPEHNAPDRFLKCLEEIKKHKVDFFLNGGDTIYAADYNNITKERVLEQWNIWQNLRNTFSEYEVHSCLGNHDMWWAAPSKNDEMYGKPYVVAQLKTPNRYYSFAKSDWHFIILDSNNDKAGSLDVEQRKWLEKDLENLPKGASVVLMSHYPILGVSTILDGGSHTDSGYITDLFYKHKDKNIHCISGHVHLLDTAVYNNVQYYCNGALSGFWWEDGDKNSAGKYWYRQTPPGYAILELYNDGTLKNTYHPHTH